MAVAVAQGLTYSSTTDTGTLTFSTSVSLANGDLLLVSLLARGSVEASPTISKASGTATLPTFTLRKREVMPNGTDTLFVWSAPMASTGTLNISIALGDAVTAAQGWLSRITGHNASNPIRWVSVATGTGSTASVSIDAASNTNNALEGGCGYSASSASATGPSGWSSGLHARVTAPTTCAMHSFRAGGSTATSYSWSLPASSDWICWVVEVWESSARPSDVTGSGSLQISSVSSSAVGSVDSGSTEISGSGALDVQSVVAAAAGTIEISGSGVLAAAAVASDGIAAMELPGSGSASMASIESSGVAVETVAGSGSSGVGALESAGVAFETIACGVEIELGHLELAGYASESIEGVVAAEVSRLEVDAAGSSPSVVVGSGSLYVGRVESSGYGEVSFAGSASVEVGSWTIGGSASIEISAQVSAAIARIVAFSGQQVGRCGFETEGADRGVESAGADGRLVESAGLSRWDETAGRLRGAETDAGREA